ncbi:cell division protein FtsX [Corynebacterium sphenisci DSM 44792]|uniref:Cell division protein FtsX n=1 Tax=Corynebacterium sphenisci DSM 44792 TaxID=1437874 RepID=A0A1L7CZE7_9CORY|nr:permease-like cell division protein FtsX [Corynebacterium sphenisci]APT91163.1 cell division protein FtsX [Corynebacterium sphenisci DSM 44792]
MKTRFVLGEALAGLRKNLTMTVAMIITTAISLALLASGLLVTDMTKRTKDMYLDRVEVMLELDEEVSAGDDACTTEPCREVLDALDGVAGVESATFRNREANHAHFVELFQATDPVLVENTTADSLPAVVLVRLADPTDLSPLAGVRELPQVVHVTDQAEDVGEAVGNLDSIRNATFVIAAIQALAAVFLIANMVQIAAYSRRKEVEIMLMVGASRLFTQAPFVLEAVIASLIGGLLAIGGLFLGKSAVVDPALGNLYRAQLIAPVQAADIWIVAPVVIAVGVIFSAITAQVTLRLYTRR